MTQWIKVEKKRPNSGRQPRKTFAISRSRANPDNTAKLICPVAHINMPMADAFVDKNLNMVRIQLVEKGEFSIQKGKGSGHTRSITMPSEVNHKLPLGLHETKVEIDAEEGFLTIDLRQFKDVLKQQEAEANGEAPPATAATAAKPKAPAKTKPATAAKPKAGAKAPAKPKADPAPAEKATQDDPAGQPAETGDGSDLL